MSGRLHRGRVKLAAAKIVDRAGQCVRVGEARKAVRYFARKEEVAAPGSGEHRYLIAQRALQGLEHG